MNRLTRWIAILCLMSFNGFAAKLQSIEIKQHAGKVSLQFRLDKAVAHKIFTLTNPNRVVIDLGRTDLAFNLNKLHLNKEFIKHVRAGSHKNHTLRLVFEVSDKVMLQAKPGNKIFSLDLLRHPTKSIKKKSLKPVIVVLDPGHGGKDPGAIGVKRISEKNITLAIAKKLKQMIDKQPGMRAVMTRNKDEYVGLRDRLDIARKFNGDIFF